MKQFFKAVILSVTIIASTIVSTEPRGSLHSQKLPLVLCIHLETMKPDQSQNGGPHFTAGLIPQIKINQINQTEHTFYFLQPVILHMFVYFFVTRGHQGGQLCIFDLADYYTGCSS